MNKIYYSNLDRFVEDTKSYRQAIEVNVYWPIQIAIIFYRHIFPDLAIYKSEDGRFESIRCLWFELETVRRAERIPYVDVAWSEIQNMKKPASDKFKRGRNSGKGKSNV